MMDPLKIFMIVMQAALATLATATHMFCGNYWGSKSSFIEINNINSVAVEGIRRSVSKKAVRC